MDAGTMSPHRHQETIPATQTQNQIVITVRREVPHLPAVAVSPVAVQAALIVQAAEEVAPAVVAAEVVDADNNQHSSGISK